MKEESRQLHKEKFPAKLHAVLELADARGSACSSDVITWLPHGRAFRILDGEGFMQTVVPMFFELTKMRSFYRQLNLWGFKR